MLFRSPLVTTASTNLAYTILDRNSIVLFADRVVLPVNPRTEPRPPRVDLTTVRVLPEFIPAITDIIERTRPRNAV